MPEQFDYRDITIYGSQHTVGADKNLGGRRSGQQITNNHLYNLLDKTTKEEQSTGITKYRCLYVFNKSRTLYLKNVAAFVVSDTTSPNDYVEVGWGVARVGTGRLSEVVGEPDDTLSWEQTIPNENTQPAGVEFFGGSTRSTGAIANADFPPQRGKPLWVKYVSSFDAQDTQYNRWTLRIVADNLITIIPERDRTRLPPQIVFNVVGNCSSDEDFTRIATDMKGTNPHFVVTTGNNNIDKNPAHFFSMMGTLMSKALLAFGPMDVTDTTLINAYTNEMNKYAFVPKPRKTYYAKTFHNVHVLVMDTSGKVGYDRRSDQYDFVVKDLQEANTNPNIDWIFVVTSRPAYGSVVMNNIRHYYIDVAETYHDIFAQNGVLCVLQGQIQWYERLTPMKFNPDEPAKPTTQAFDGPDNYTILGQKNFKDSVMWITVGHGGGPHDTSTAVEVGKNGVEGFNHYDDGYLKIIVENRLQTPKIIIRCYITSRNTTVFLDQTTVTRTE